MPLRAAAPFATKVGDPAADCGSAKPPHAGRGRRLGPPPPQRSAPSAKPPRRPPRSPGAGAAVASAAAPGAHGGGPSWPPASAPPLPPPRCASGRRPVVPHRPAAAARLPTASVGAGARAPARPAQPAAVGTLASSLGCLARRRPPTPFGCPPPRLAPRPSPAPPRRGAPAGGCSALAGVRRLSGASRAFGSGKPGTPGRPPPVFDVAPAAVGAAGARVASPPPSASFAAHSPLGGTLSVLAFLAEPVCFPSADGGPARRRRAGFGRRLAKPVFANVTSALGPARAWWPPLFRPLSASSSQEARLSEPSPPRGSGRACAPSAAASLRRPPRSGRRRPSGRCLGSRAPPASSPSEPAAAGLGGWGGGGGAPAHRVLRRRGPCRARLATVRPRRWGRRRGRGLRRPGRGRPYDLGGPRRRAGDPRRGLQPGSPSGGFGRPASLLAAGRTWARLRPRPRAALPVLTRPAASTACSSTRRRARSSLRSACIGTWALPPTPPWRWGCGSGRPPSSPPASARRLGPAPRSPGWDAAHAEARMLAQVSTGAARRRSRRGPPRPSGPPFAPRPDRSLLGASAWLRPATAPCRGARPAHARRAPSRLGPRPTAPPRASASPPFSVGCASCGCCCSNGRALGRSGTRALCASARSRPARLRAALACAVWRARASPCTALGFCRRRRVLGRARRGQV